MIRSALLRFLLGDDVFISYSRADAATYAPALADELGKRGISCYLDQWDTEPGIGIPPRILRALNHSAIFVVIASPAAVRSVAVGQELRAFQTTRRPIVPISVAGALQTAQWIALLSGAAVSEDTGANLSGGTPSPQVLKRIESSTRFTRRNARVRRTFVASAAGLVLLAVATGLASMNARKGAAEARRQQSIAEEKENLANQRRQETERQKLQAQRHLYASRLTLARDAWERGNTATVVQTLESLLVRPPDPDFRGFEWFHFRKMARGPGRLVADTQRPIKAVAVSPDGRRLAAGGWDGLVRVWSTRDWKEEHRFGGAGLVDAVAFAPDGRHIAFGGSLELIKVCDLKRPSCVELSETGFVGALAFSPRSGDLAVASNASSRKTSGSDVALWTPSIRRRRLLAHLGQTIRSLAFSPDGQTIALAGGDGLMRQGATGVLEVWDIQRLRRTARLLGHTGIVYAVTFSPDGTQIASGGLDNHVIIWQKRGYRLHHVFEGHENRVLSVAYAPGSRFLASGSVDQRIIVWDTSRQLRVRFVMGNTDGVGGLAFTKDGKLLVAGNEGGEFVLWDWESEPAQQKIATQAGEINRVAFLDNDCMVTAADNGLAVWALGRVGVSCRQHDAGFGQAAAVATSPDGRVVVAAVGWPKWEMRCWRGRSSTADWIVASPDSLIWDLAITRDGALIAAATSKGTVLVLDGYTGAKVGPTFSGCRGTDCSAYTGASLAFDSSGRFLAWGSRDGANVKIWDVQRKVWVVDEELSPGGVTSLSFSPNGRLLAVGAGVDESTRRTAVSVWNVQRLDQIEAVCTFGGHVGEVSSVRFSPDGQTVASGSWDTTVKLWDPLTCDERMTLRSHQTPVFALAFAPSGGRLASAGRDGTVLIWDAEQVPTSQP